MFVRQLGLKIIEKKHPNSFSSFRNGQKLNSEVSATSETIVKNLRHKETINSESDSLFSHQGKRSLLVSSLS